ncbi:MAG: RluA family pseudouridine synthase [Oscillospiraceae bacterium]|jgi:23S rRNA pseudouridine1911/1915/1917 synthase|nr:RluA family pseudouridine synthase [Oscillospiraceae bacterium]
MFGKNIGENKEQEYFAKFIVQKNEHGIRLDRFLPQKIEMYSRSFLTSLIDSKKVLVKQKNVFLPAKKKYILKIFDEIEVYLKENIASKILVQDLPIEIIYEDDYLLVINKSKGMAVHPAPGNYQDTLVNALLFHKKNELSGINGVMRPGIVHRLDKDTSGLLIVAKNDFAHWKLSEQIRNHNVKRCYEAVVNGNLKYKHGTINAPIGRHPKNRKCMAVTNKNSKYAVTHYEVLNKFGNFTHIKIFLETGRTHQIRVHMAYIGHSIVGDKVYGKSNNFDFLNGQCLHAREIGFMHPKSKQYVEFSSDLPDYFNKLLILLKMS